MNWILAVVIGPAHTWAGQFLDVPQIVPLLDPADPTTGALRSIGTGGRDPYAEWGPEAGSGIDQVAALLGEVCRQARSQMGGTSPARILVTHPDDWSTEQLGALRRAGSKAGLGIDPVPEAVALASAYKADGGAGSHLVILDAERHTAAAVARLGKVFVTLATERADGSLMPAIEQLLAQPGVRPEALDAVLLLRDETDGPAMGAIAELLHRKPTEVSRQQVAVGALHYDHSVHEVPPPPQPPPPPPPPPRPTPPVQRVNHAVAPQRKPGLNLVKVLLIVLGVLIVGELLFVFWPF